ncbi:g8983 [Coccomyxa elongata]
MVPIFHNTNGTFFLDNTKNHYKCSEDGGWHDFFAWEDQLVPWTQEKEDAEPDAPCIRHDISTVNKVVFEDLKLSWDELDFIGVKKAWKYQPWVQEAIDKRLDKLADVTPPTIGFHVRGGDKLAEDTMLNRQTTQVNDLIRKFTMTWPDVKAGTCVMMGDDQARISAASKLAAKEIGCKVFKGSPYYRKEGHLQDHFNQQSYEDKCSGTVQLLIDMELLAHTDYFIGSYNSRWPRVVQYLRYVLYDKDRSTSVDASAYGLDLFSNIQRIFQNNAQA